ncbi:DUF600 family protein [Bacillus coagulans]|uniref:immunity protein YezG family protein n=1 Tax=Heyndrickxia coagulans TaxID=1398 RepID=UPI00077912A5|nr:immunity protein YezG family protein [Heyndrickxia coagulans]NCG68477.1 DUF600 family protein [Heyndrickxia coagulans]
MNSKQMELIYQQLANVLNEMIPEEWKKILMYSEIREGYAQMFFYYYPINCNQPTYSLDLTDIFDNIDPSRYNELKYKLYDLCEKLWVEFKKQGQEQWTSLTYILENTGKMNIHFTYNDLSQLDPIKKQDKWEDEYINNE